jgi:hypothetical protein
MKALGLALALAATPALAWESTCYTYADPTLEPAALSATKVPYCAPEAGTNTARQRWVGGLDEHRQIWEQSRAHAGLPSSTSSTLQLRVFTSSEQVTVAGQALTSLLPVPFEQATRVQVRSVTPGELAQLPDFSYALWDWATGHETCPLDGAGVTAEECHDFATHMGPVNSNHFVPQSSLFYGRYHALALARAQECKAMQGKLTPTSGRFDIFTEACEAEALAIEAVAHHYLQDAWSMGHMWQRWGSANLTDFPGAGEDQRDRAVLIALTAGLVHGSRAVLQRLPAWTSYDVNDALCAPNDVVRYVGKDGVALHALGDDYLDQLPAPGSTVSSDLLEQSRRLYSCATSGMLAVYKAAGENHGASQPLATGLGSVDPTGADCFGQRATNEAMLTAAAVQLKVAGQQANITLDSRLVGWLVPKVARNNGSVPVSAGLRNRFRFDLQRMVSVTHVLAATKPKGTEAADGRLGDFLGAKPNGQYLGLASYVDPSLPWPATPDASPQAKERATALARVFHRAHAGDWCTQLGTAELDAMKAHVASTSLDAAGKDAACQACAEFAVRHVRLGTAASYDTAQEPLCHYLATTPAYLYQPAGAGEPAAAARAWCGCP